MILAIIFCVTVGLLSFQECKAASLFPYGDTEGDARVSTVDDGSSPLVTLSHGFVYFGRVETLLYVNTNGLLSFQEAYAGDVSPRTFPLSSKAPALIAPFWDDIDITRFGSVFYRQTANCTLLRQASDQIRMTKLVGTANYSPTTLFIATWDRVAEYKGPTRASEENTFQAVLATNGQTSFVLFVYGSIQWGQASIGFNAGDGIHFFMVPGALGPATRDMETQSNVNVSGLYIYRVDGPTVVSPDAISPYLLFANRRFIQRLNLNGSGFTTVVSEQNYAFGLDFDYRKKYLYWINSDQYGIIRRANLDGSEVTTLVNLQRRFSTIDIAVDWINQKLYFVDAVLLRQIEVYDLSSGSQKVLISTGSNTSPRAIVIDPCKRLMYWTNWGNSRNAAKIERASMDGAARVVLHSTDLVRPSGLAIDYEAQMLYWTDTYLDKIESSNTDGSARKLITRDNVLLPFAITVFDNVLYWTDVRLLAVLTRDTGSMKNTTILLDSLRTQPTGIQVIAIDRQPEAQNPCSENNGDCSHLCLLSAVAEEQYSCACPENLTLAQNQRDCVAIIGLERKEYSVSENSSQGVEVCIIFSGIETVTVNISTEDITAIGGLDYTALVTIVKINPGDRECISIPIIDDSLQENTEEFAVILNINDVSVKRSIPFTRVKIMDVSCISPCVNGICLDPGPGVCRCDPGWRGAACSEALECPILVAPMNGTIECSNQTTGGNCNFSCQGGFNLVSSQVRMCLPSVTWSGSTTSCEPQHCETLEAPENGFVLLPCTGEYGSSCTIQCKQGYEINGTTPFKQTCLLENDELYWTNSTNCTEIDICESNPCQHGGSCTQVGDAAFECECEGTGYTGPTCNRGIVTTPDIPTLAKDMVTNSLNISALPDHELIITISGGESIQASPSMVQLNATTTTASFTVTGRTVGFYSIQYRLSGEDASNFVTPEDAAIFVQSTSPRVFRNRYFQELMLSVGRLEDSCCEPIDAFFQCRRSNASNRVVLRSACSWASGGAGVNSQASAGVVFAVNQDLKLPISVAGIEVDSGSFRSTLPQISLGSCTPCPAVQPNCNQGNSMCYCYNFSVSDTIDFLRSFSLAVTYIRNVRGLLPSWFQDIQAFPRGSNLRGGKYVNYEYTTDLVSADNIRKLRGCEMVQPDNDASGLYSVLRYGRAMIGRIDRQILRYIDRSIQPDLENPMCFAVNLCKGTESPVFIQLSPRIHNIVLSRFLRTYVRRNWDIQIDSVALSRAGISLGSSTTDEYWNGVSLFQPELPQFDLIVNTRSKTHFQTGNLSLDLSFSGKIHYLYQEKDGVMEGKSTINITHSIATRSISLFLSTSTNTPSQAVVNILDTNSEEVCAQQDPRPSGIAFKMLYRQYPEQEFFSNLLSFTKNTVDCPINVFVNLDDDLGLQGLSFHTRCPHLNLGRLIFTGMEHRFYFSGIGDFSPFCFSETGYVSETPLLIKSTLRSSSLQLGKFMTLHPGNDSPTLLVRYTSENTNFYAEMNSVRVSLLGTIFSTNMIISSNVLKYTANINIFSSYLANLSVSAAVDEAPWERLRLRVFGTMDNGTSDSSGSFNQLVESATRAELDQRGKLAFQLEMSAMAALNRSIEKFMDLEQELQGARQENRQLRVNQLLMESESARINKNSARANYQRILNEYEADLRIYHLLEEYIQASAIFKITDITFNITIVTESPNYFPLLISYTTPHNGLMFQKQVNFNFVAPKELIIGQIAQEIVDDYSV